MAATAAAAHTVLWRILYFTVIPSGNIHSDSSSLLTLPSYASFSGRKGLCSFLLSMITSASAIQLKPLISYSHASTLIHAHQHTLVHANTRYKCLQERLKVTSSVTVLFCPEEPGITQPVLSFCHQPLDNLGLLSPPETSEYLLLPPCVMMSHSMVNEMFCVANSKNANAIKLVSSSSPAL